MPAVWESATPNSMVSSSGATLPDKRENAATEPRATLANASLTASMAISASSLIPVRFE